MPEERTYHWKTIRILRNEAPSEESTYAVAHCVSDSYCNNFQSWKPFLVWGRCYVFFICNVSLLRATHDVLGNPPCLSLPLLTSTTVLDISNTYGIFTVHVHVLIHASLMYRGSSVSQISQSQTEQKWKEWMINWSSTKRIVFARLVFAANGQSHGLSWRRPDVASVELILNVELWLLRLHLCEFLCIRIPSPSLSVPTIS